MILRKFLIWKWQSAGRWLVMCPFSHNVYSHPTWAAAIGFVSTVITGRQGGRR